MIITHSSISIGYNRTDREDVATHVAHRLVQNTKVIEQAEQREYNKKKLNPPSHRVMHHTSLNMTSTNRTKSSVV